MRHTILLLLALLLAMGQTQAQKSIKGKSTAKVPEVVIVDDEACGCELVYIDGIQTIERDGLFGFKTADGTEIVPPRYKYVGQFQEGFCLVLTDQEHYGLINARGEEVMACIYQDIQLPTEGLVKAQKDGLCGFWDTLGHEVIPPSWPSASCFFEGLAVVGEPVGEGSEETHFGYIDHRGKVVIPLQYQYAYPFQNGYAVVKLYDKFGMIDRKGHMVLHSKYDLLTSMYEDRCFGIDPREGMAAMISDKFKPITDYKYSDVIGYGDGLYTVRLSDGKYTFLDKRGKEHFGPFDGAGTFIEGRCMVMQGGKYGIIDTKGHAVLPIEYDNSGYRSEEYYYFDGLALVEKDGLYGYVDRDGHIVVPIIYRDGYRYSEGIAPVQGDTGWGYIDREGQMVIPFIFDICSYFEYGRAEVVYRGEVYKINPKGQCVKNCKTFPKFPRK